jgi:hypothetical protein
MNTQGLAPEASSGLQRRQGFFDATSDFIGDTADKAKRTFAIRGQRALDLSTDFSGRCLLNQAISNTGLSASIECNECRTRGGLDINMDVDILSGLKGLVEVRPLDLGAVPVAALAATATAELGATPTDAAPAIGNVSNLLNSDSEDCSSMNSEGSQFFDTQCKQFIFNGGAFTWAPFSFPPFDAEESNCILSFFGDDTCATQLDTAFQPSSGQCFPRVISETVLMG